MSDPYYENVVKGKGPEDILANPESRQPSPRGEHLRVSAQVISSENNRKLAQQIVWLTWILAAASLGQTVATAWPYLVWWIMHGLRFR